MAPAPRCGEVRRWWLACQCPKLLHIHQGVQERRAAKLAWQVMSEEFGDGDLSKNHVHIYNGLLKRLDGAASTGDEPGFDGLSKDEGIPRCWIAAVAQQ